MSPGAARVRRARVDVADLATFGALAVFGYALKQHYSSATPEGLRFILGPTAWLLELLTGARWPFEAGVGYVSTASATAIVPACAGVNFWIVATATLVVGFCGSFQRLRAKLAFFGCAVALGFGCTLLVNALRIAIDLWMRELAFSSAVHAEAHRLLGDRVPRQRVPASRGRRALYGRGALRGAA